MSEERRRPTARVNTRVASRRGAGKCQTCGRKLNSHNVSILCHAHHQAQREAHADLMDEMAEGIVLAHVESILAERGIAKPVTPRPPLGLSLASLQVQDARPGQRVLQVGMCSRGVCDDLLLWYLYFRLPLRRSLMSVVYADIIAAVARMKRARMDLHAS